MDACCEHKAEELTGLRGGQRRVLVLVLAINAVLFVVAAIAWLFLRTAWTVLQESLREYRAVKPALISAK
jgi:hypothetical protein